LNLEVVKTDVERGLILVRGAVPGAKGGWVLIRDAVKRPPKEAPTPGAIRARAASAHSARQTNTTEQPGCRPQSPRSTRALPGRSSLPTRSSIWSRVRI